VQVPLGGVEQGQKFTVPFSSHLNNSSSAGGGGGGGGYSGTAIPRVSVPVGAWKDGLCDCCSLGCIHPVIWNAYCCSLILVGQIMVRLRLTFLGDEIPYNSSSAIMNSQAGETFKILALITILRFVITQTISVIAHSILLGRSTYEEAQRDQQILVLLTGITYTINIAYAILLIYLIARTRYRIRSRYGIPEQNCHGCEDCCCAYWCPCCTVSQMARHTADYDNYAANCCSETGLGRNAPSIV
jgi:Cys-rich protein (TIGR01571 family)